MVLEHSPQPAHVEGRYGGAVRGLGVVEERNSTIDFENDSLASNAGMEDAVREKYGYIVAGEETAIVTGLSEDTLENIHGASDVEGNVLSSSVKAPEEWYTPFLDAFFGVE